MSGHRRHGCPWGALLNTKVGVGGWIGVRRQGVGEREVVLRTRGIAVCVQNPWKAYPGNRLPAST